VIHVTFVNAATGEVLGEADLPDEQLPESFAKPTTMHLPDGDWHVERAEPPEFRVAGSLRLTLRKIESIDPAKLLYSLPTIDNALPPLTDGDADAAFRMHEDDWRQVELVARRFKEEIESELAAIRAVRAERKGVAFPRIHLRRRIPNPLDGVVLRLEEVRTAFSGVVQGLTLRDCDGVIDGGFAIAIEGGILYGREERGHVAVLGLAGGADAATLAALAGAHQLVLVDWCGATTMTADRA